MPMHKSTNIFSEIGKFFKENDASKAMYSIHAHTKHAFSFRKDLFQRREQMQL